MTNTKPYRIKTISEFHRFRNLPKPGHPLISVINVEQLKRLPDTEPASLILDFYSISIKRDISGKIKYGQQQYDFDEGVMFFIAPNQIFGFESDTNEMSKQSSGWMLLVHLDFLWNTPLTKTIKQYEFFYYSVKEALFLSEKEEAIITNIIQNIQQEYHSNIDNFSQQIIISQIETLLNYAERFYHRQFITRKITNHKILDRLEELLAAYFNDSVNKGLPTV